MFGFFERPGPPAGRFAVRRRVRPVLEGFEGRMLLSTGMMSRHPDSLLPHPGAIHLSHVRMEVEVTAASAPTLEELGQMAIENAGRRASHAKVVHEVIMLLNEHIGFNLSHSLFGAGHTPTPGELEGAFEAAYDLPADDPNRGYDCITLSTMAAQALRENSIPGSISVVTYIPQPGNPKKAIEGSLSNPPVTNPDDPTEMEFLFDRHGGANNFEATLVYSDHGKTYYFPGGTNRVYSTPDKVLTLFPSLGWSQYDPATNQVHETSIIYRYKKPASSVHLH